MIALARNKKTGEVLEVEFVGEFPIVRRWRVADVAKYFARKESQPLSKKTVTRWLAQNKLPAPQGYIGGEPYWDPVTIAAAKPLKI